MTRLDELIAQFDNAAESGYDSLQPKAIEHAIREAYRIGHADGRNARIPQGEETFAARLQRQQEESRGQES